MTLNLFSWEQSIIRRIFLSFYSNYTERNRVHRSRNNKRERCLISSYQFISVAQSCPTLCNPMNRSMPSLPVQHQLPDSTQTHVYPTISSSVVPFFSCPQSFPESQFFQWVSSLHLLAKVLELSICCVCWSLSFIPRRKRLNFNKQV